MFKTGGWARLRTRVLLCRAETCGRLGGPASKLSSAASPSSPFTLTGGKKIKTGKIMFRGPSNPMLCFYR